MVFWIILILVLLLNLAWWWWADQALRVLPQRRLWRCLLGFFMAVQLAFFLCVIVLRLISIRPFIPAPVMAGLYIWHLTVLPGAMTLLALAILAFRLPRQIGAWIARAWPRRHLRLAAGAGQERPHGPTRRQLLRAAAVAVPPLLTAGAAQASLCRLGDFRVRSMELLLPRLPAALDGLRIAHISDVHTGRFTPDAKLRAIAGESNALKPDLVLLTGDLLDFSILDLPRAVEMVRSLRAPLGVYLCEGNHDLLDDRLEFEFGLKRSGLHLLLDESACLVVNSQHLQLLGLRWNRAGRYDAQIRQDVARLLRLRRNDAFTILLAHHPHAFDTAAMAGVPLTLSGHTHGGQLMVNQRYGAGPVLFRYWSGLYERGDSALVVSNGVGNWFPLRINAPAEIVHITLRRKSGNLLA